MDFTECITFAMQNPLTYIATTDGDQPRVRAFAMWFADATGFYYHTGTTKSVWRQLQKNPRVELCFYAPDTPGAGKMLRISGAIEIMRDPALADRLLRDRPWLKSILTDTTVNTGLAIFRIAHGEARFWTMENNLREQDAPRVIF